jgi:hypothetical protein
VQAAITAARERSQLHRQAVADAEASYDRFLADVAVPLARQVANAFKAEGYSFTVSTPGRGVRIASDRGATTTWTSARHRRRAAAWSSGTSDTRAAHARSTKSIRSRQGAAPSQISEEELLEFVMRALQPWIDR